jgi:hypothetical protein
MWGLTWGIWGIYLEVIKVTSVWEKIMSEIEGLSFVDIQYIEDDFIKSHQFILYVTIV